MKKVFLFSALFAILFNSCSKDESDGFDYDLNTLYGTWLVETVSINDEAPFNLTSSIYVSKYGKTTATFKSGGTYSAEGFFGKGSGTYLTNGKFIRCYISGDEFAKYEVLSLSGGKSNLKMTFPDEDGYILLTCSKE